MIYQGLLQRGGSPNGVWLIIRGSVVYMAKIPGRGRPVAGDGVKRARFFSRKGIPKSLAFDHGRVLQDYYARHAGTESGAE